MSWSPSKARLLPALRPDLSPSSATLKGRPTALQVSRLRSSYVDSYSLQPKHKAETQASPNPTSIGSKSRYFPLPRATKPQEAFTNDETEPARPSKAPRLQSRSSEDATRALSLSASPGQAATNQPFFSLTEQELQQLRKSMGKGPKYKNFKDTTIAQYLDHLGRGWIGFLRARDKAEQDGTIDAFWRHLGPELKAILSTAQTPLGGLSLEAAAMAAQTKYRSSVGSLQAEPAAEIRQLRMKSRTSLPDTGQTGPDSSLCDSSKAVRIPSYSTSVPETDSKIGKRLSPDPGPSSRPKRVLQRPDYRIPPLLESSPEPPSIPKLLREPSPTPREIYDKIQPKFIQYPCEWKGCKATLKNLETLRKHVRIVHAEAGQGTLCCQWDNCGASIPILYESPQDLNDHITATHLTSLEWRLGDGHKCCGVVAKASGS